MEDGEYMKCISWKSEENAESVFHFYSIFVVVSISFTKHTLVQTKEKTEKNERWRLHSMVNIQHFYIIKKM